MGINDIGFDRQDTTTFVVDIINPILLLVFKTGRPSPIVLSVDLRVKLTIGIAKSMIVEDLAGRPVNRDPELIFSRSDVVQVRHRVKVTRDYDRHVLVLLVRQSSSDRFIDFDQIVT